MDANTVSFRYDLKDYEGALALYKRTLELDATHALALSGCGNVLKDQGELAAALEMYKKAAAAAPMDPTFIFNTAQVYPHLRVLFHAQTWL